MFNSNKNEWASVPGVCINSQLHPKFCPVHTVLSQHNFIVNNETCSYSVQINEKLMKWD